jgi:hypothetical protein
VRDAEAELIAALDVVLRERCDPGIADAGRAPWPDEEDRR